MPPTGAVLALIGVEVPLNMFWVCSVTGRLGPPAGIITRAADG